MVYQYNKEKIVVDYFHFDLVEGAEEMNPQVNVNVNNVVPSDESMREEIIKNGNVYRLEVSYEIAFEHFKVSGQNAQIVQILDYFDEFDALPEDKIQELTYPLVEYIERLTYEVTEIAFDEPGIELNFSKDPEKK